MWAPETMPSERFCGHCSLGRHGVGCVLEGKCVSVLLLVVCVECWGKFEQRVAGGERWIFNFAFCVLAVSPPPPPLETGEGSHGESGEFLEFFSGCLSHHVC